MKHIFQISAYALSALSMLFFTGCADEVSPTDVATQKQIGQSATAQESLLYGLPALMTKCNTTTSTYGYMDFGYPSQMYMRDVYCEDMPTNDDTYDYFRYHENGTYQAENNYYNYIYYYKLIKNANNLISAIGNGTVNATSRQYRGVAKSFRALFYLDMARMFEFQKTGVTALDAKAEAVKGLTVPIVTESTTAKQAKNNPRAPFYTMYRFILSDLNNAEQDLKGYARPDKTLTDKTVVWGLKARFWLEVGTRFRMTPDDLALQLQHEGDADGYDSLNIKTANEAFTLAAAYADSVIKKGGYTPMTKTEWLDGQTAFNTECKSWMWMASIGTQEQVPSTYYWTLQGQLASEPKWGMPQYANAFRMISKKLYDAMPQDDWRKDAFVSPDDAGSNSAPEKYHIQVDSTYWKKMPAYANLKFRVRDNAAYLTGVISDIPLMRVEEMYFIKAEAIAMAGDYEEGMNVLNDFMQTYRYESFASEAEDEYDLQLEVLDQKRIEFWGEGLVFFDYKRMKHAITRSYKGTNYLEAYRLNSNPEYVAPWMNLYIPDAEKNNDPAIILNPDPSEAISPTSSN